MEQIMEEQGRQYQQGPKSSGGGHDFLNPMENQALFKTSSCTLMRAKQATATATPATSTIENSYIMGAKRVLNFMYNLWLKQRLCDVTITAADQKMLHAHKIAIGAYSNTLNECFLQQAPGSVFHIQLVNYDAKVISNILKFFYTTNIELDETNIEEVLGCSMEIAVDTITMLCKDFLLHYEVNTALFHYTVAKKNDLVDVESKIYDYICDNYYAVSQTEHYMNSHLRVVRQLAKENRLNVQSELEVLFAVVSWIDHNRVERLAFAPGLVSCVRMHLLSPEDLVTQVEGMKHIFSFPQCQTQLYSALKFHALKLSGSPLREEFPVQRQRNRTAAALPQARTGSSHDSKTSIKKSSQHSIASNTAIGPPPQQQPQQQQQPLYQPQIMQPQPHGAAKMVLPVPTPSHMQPSHIPPSHIPPSHIPPSHIPPSHMPPSHIPPSPSPTSLTQMPIRVPSATQIPVPVPVPVPNSAPVPSTPPLPGNVSSPSSRTAAPPVSYDVSLANEMSLVAVGGLDLQQPDSDSPGRSVFKLDQACRQWRPISTLAQYTHHHGVIALGSTIFVIGGVVYDPRDAERLGGATKSCHAFHGWTGVWRPMAAMREARAYLAVAAYNGFIYAVGGEDQNLRKLDSVECYDVKRDHWSLVARMPRGGKIGMSVATWKDALYIVGGYTKGRAGNPVLADVECFDLQQQRWIARRQLDLPRCHANLVAVTDRLYLVGGRAKLEDGPQTIISLSNVDVYEDATDTWRRVGDLSVARHDAGCAVVGSKIYVLGGMTTPSPYCLSSVECFDVATGKWEEGVTDLPYNTSGVACCTLPKQPLFGTDSQLKFTPV